MKRTIRITPCNKYSVTPAEKKEEKEDKNSCKIKVGAAIILTPKSDFLLRQTPSAIKTVPKIHINSDVLGILLCNFGILNS